MATNNYNYLAKLEYDRTKNIYNLFITTYSGLTVNLFVFITERKHEMRLDIISNELYSTTEYVGDLCQLNNILNPFSIRANDIIFYPSEEDLKDLSNVKESIRQSGIEELISAAKSDLIKALKKKKPDVNKKRFNDKRNEDQLPPTILSDNAPITVLDNNKIKIAPNLFRNPKQDPVGIGNADGNINGNVNDNGNINGNGDQEQQDTTERVLINRYIKLINN